MAAECETRPPSIVRADCNDYFLSLGYLARRILVEQEVVHSMSAWDSLNNAERDEALNKYFIQEEVKNKYDDEETFENDETAAEKQQESVFPRYVVKSGEKIVVDFENPSGFSTWEDEHSGPFSWHSKAQREDNPFEIDLKSFKRKSKTPRERTQSGSEDKGFAFNPNKSIWDSPFLKADASNPLESSGFGDLFKDMGGLSLSPTAERCESPPLVEDLHFGREQEDENNEDGLQAFCSRETLNDGVSQDDECSSLGDYIEMSEPNPDIPVIKLKTPFSFKKKSKTLEPGMRLDTKMMKREEKVTKLEEKMKTPEEKVKTLPAESKPEKIVPAYASAVIPKREAKKEREVREEPEPMMMSFPLYEPEPIPKPRVYRKEAPKKHQAPSQAPPQVPPHGGGPHGAPSGGAPSKGPRERAPPVPQPVLEDAGEIYEPVMIGGDVAQPYEVVDLERLTIESMPLPPEDDGGDEDEDDIDANDYYQSFEESMALTKKTESARLSLDPGDLPPPIMDFGDVTTGFSDVITEQPTGESETVRLVVDLERLTIESMPLPPEDDGGDEDEDDIDANDYYQSFEESMALTKKTESARLSLDPGDLPPPIMDFGDVTTGFSDVITEQPTGESETVRLLGDDGALSPPKSGFSFLDDW